MTKNSVPSSTFEERLTELEKIVNRLEEGKLSLEEALDEFEKGVKLVRLGKKNLQQAEQRIQILLSDDAEAPLSIFTEDK